MKDHEIDALTETLNLHTKKYINIVNEIKSICETNIDVDWDFAEITPNEEFKNILKIIKKMEEKWKNWLKKLSKT